MSLWLYVIIICAAEQAIALDVEHYLAWNATELSSEEWTRINEILDEAYTMAQVLS